MKTRLSNIELLRIILILFIILHHLILNAIGIRELHLLDEIYYRFFSTINVFLVCSVNIFFLISGFFKIKFHKKKILSLVVDVYIIHAIMTLLFNYNCMSIDLIKSIIFPISQYWFILVYIFLSILSPIINSGLESLNKKYKVYIVSFCFIFFSILESIQSFSIFGINKGYSLMFAMFLYLLGDLIKEYNKELDSKCIFIIFSLVTIINFSVVWILPQENIWGYFSYNNPMIVINSSCLFYLMTKLKIGYIKSINVIAQYTLLIYIIHSNYSFQNIYKKLIQCLLTKNIIHDFVVIVICLIFLYLLCLLISIIYEKIKLFVYCYMNRLILRNYK